MERIWLPSASILRVPRLPVSRRMAGVSRGVAPRVSSTSPTCDRSSAAWAKSTWDGEPTFNREREDQNHHSNAWHITHAIINIEIIRRVHVTNVTRRCLYSRGERRRSEERRV